MVSSGDAQVASSGQAEAQRGASGQAEAQGRDGGQAKAQGNGAERGEGSARRSSSAMGRQQAAQSDLPRRIYMLGTGSIGKLVAHSLRGIANPPPITLLFHRYPLVKAWQESRKQITIQDEEFEVARDGFDFEFLPPTRRWHGVELRDDQPEQDLGTDVRPHEAAKVLERQNQETAEGSSERSGEKGLGTRSGPGDKYISNEPIHNLIVTTKAVVTVAALSALRHRLSSDSTICFLQNGMGIIEDVNKHVFPEEADRPSYVQGIITHGVNVPPQIAATNPFYAVHAGHGTIALGLLPRSGVTQSALSATDGEDQKDIKTELWAPSARHILRTLTRTPVLCAVGFTPTELLQQQLEKLAVNSVLNPLTALLDARNGSLLYNFALTRTLRLMLAETSHVIRSLPELRDIPNLHLRFGPDRLETLVVSVAEKTKDNVSSMLADVRAGARTEIEYINGYIVKRGEELDIKCVVNYAIMQTVIGKSYITQHEFERDVPTLENLNKE